MWALTRPWHVNVDEIVVKARNQASGGRISPRSMTAQWRVVIVTRILPVALGFHAAVREAGHDPVALLTIRDTDGRYGGFDLAGCWASFLQSSTSSCPRAARRSRRCSTSVRPDLVVCMGFPWKVPADALAVPPLGWINGHPSLLPHHRGPVPVAWTIRDGEEEFGITFHRMDAELDTGPILAQKAAPVGELCEPEELYGRMGPLVIEVLGEALANLAAGRRRRRAGRRRLPELLRRRGCAARFLAAGGGGAPAHLGVALHDRRRRAPRRARRSSTARPCACSRRRSPRSTDAVRVECADAPLWLVKTEPVSRT